MFLAFPDKGGARGEIRLVTIRWLKLVFCPTAPRWPPYRGKQHKRVAIRCLKFVFHDLRFLRSPIRGRTFWGRCCGGRRRAFCAFPHKQANRGIRRGIRWGSSGDPPVFWGIRSVFVSVWCGFWGDPFEGTVVFYNFKKENEVRRGAKCPVLCILCGFS